MAHNVILIVIDCLRADHCSAYGYERATTPTLERLANQGVLWEQAHSASSWTKPSATSILTGLYPSQHGAFEGIKRSQGRMTVTTDRLDDTASTLAERFTAAGWRCAAFMKNAQLSEFVGLQRGFEHYDPDVGCDNDMLEALERWLSQKPDQPAFAYVHFMEAHWPYRPRRRHVKMFGGDRDANYFRGFRARDFGRLRREILRGRATLSDAELEHLTRMYDGAVRRLDGKLPHIERILERLGLADQTALFVTADHGEEFLEHGGIGHGQTVYEELTHVPLVGVFPDGPRGRRIPEPVSQVDLADTLLRIAGAADSDVRYDLLDPGASTRPVVSELRMRRHYHQSLQTDNWKVYRRIRFDCDRNSPEIHKPARQLYFEKTYDVQCELYDLSCDRGERNNLAGQAEFGPMLDRRLSELERWWDESTQGLEFGETTEVEIDSRVVQRLRDLGYVE